MLGGVLADVEEMLRALGLSGDGARLCRWIAFPMSCCGGMPHTGCGASGVSDIALGCSTEMADLQFGLDLQLMVRHAALEM